MKATIRSRFIAGLLALGYKQTDTRSSKYLLFTKAYQPDPDVREHFSYAPFIWVGASTSLRYGKANRIDASKPFSDASKHRIMKAGDTVKPA